MNNETLNELLKEVNMKMLHAFTFISSREKMHPDGQKQFEACLHRVQHTIATQQPSEISGINNEDINNLRDALCEMAGDMNLLTQQLQASFPKRESASEISEKVIISEDDGCFAIHYPAKNIMLVIDKDGEVTLSKKENGSYANSAKPLAPTVRGTREIPGDMRQQLIDAIGADQGWEESAVHMTDNVVLPIIAPFLKQKSASEIPLLDPDMPSQELRLHMGEMTAQEVRTARAAIRWANSSRAPKREYRKLDVGDYFDDVWPNSKDRVGDTGKKNHAFLQYVLEVINRIEGGAS